MILTHPGSFPSAKVLRDEILDILDWEKKQLLVTKNPEKIKKLHFRYGNSSSLLSRRITDVGFNRRSFINLCANKNSMNEHASRHNIKTPELSTINSRMPSREDFPFLVRTTLTGQGGEGIKIYDSFRIFLKALSQGDISYQSYWTPYFQFSEEYRIHVLGGKIAKSFRKEWNEGEEPEQQIYIRNDDNTHFYRVKPKNLSDNIKKLVERFDIMYKGMIRPDANYYTALDVGIDENDDAILIEANSAPGLNESTAKLYAEFLVENCPTLERGDEEEEETEEETVVRKKVSSNDTAGFTVSF